MSLLVDMYIPTEQWYWRDTVRIIVFGDRLLHGKRAEDYVRSKLRKLTARHAKVTLLVTCPPQIFDPPTGIEQITAKWCNGWDKFVEYHPTDKPDQYARWMRKGEQQQARVPYYPKEIWEGVQGLLLFERSDAVPFDATDLPKPLLLHAGFEASIKVRRVLLP